MPGEQFRQPNPLNSNHPGDDPSACVSATAETDNVGADETRSSTESRPNSDSNHLRSARTRPKALIIEDYTPCMDAYRMALEDVQNVEVFYAECGRDAIDLIRQHDFCIVITDLGLPDYSGYEIKEEHHRLKPHDHSTRYVLVTGYDSEEQRKKSRDLGFDEHIEKPISILRLLNLIDECATDNNPE